MLLSNLSCGFANVWGGVLNRYFPYSYSESPAEFKCIFHMPDGSISIDCYHIKPAGRIRHQTMPQQIIHCCIRNFFLLCIAYGFCRMSTGSIFPVFYFNKYKNLFVLIYRFCNQINLATSVPIIFF